VPDTEREKLRNEAIEQLAHGRHEKAIDLQRRVLDGQSNTDDSYPTDCLQLGVLLFNAGRYQQVIELLLPLEEQHRQDKRFHRMVGLGYLKTGQPELGIDQLLIAERIDPDDFDILDFLALGYGDMGDLERAREYGERTLRLKDREACEHGTAFPIPDSPPPPFDATDPDRNIIAFSLWGDRPRYLHGALRNSALSPDLYPGWRCRFYCDDSVPREVMGELESLGAQVRMMGRGKFWYEGLFWRFTVADDPQVRRFLVRDCDSVLNTQERVAVDEWLASDRHFHVMRDSHAQAELIPAGLWGGVTGVLPPVTRLMEEGFRYAGVPTRVIDQHFLRGKVWPTVKQSCVIHDSLYRLFGAKDFPAYGRLPEGRSLGQNEWALRSAGTPVPRYYPAAAAASPAGHSTGVPGPASKGDKTFVFPITTGRSGTVYLSELLRINLDGAEVHHERLGYLQLGVDTPDASHFTTFNSAGNVDSVQAFWQQKLDRIADSSAGIYAECSHFLAKAGLVENLHRLQGRGSTHLILLKRDPKKVYFSLLNRFDFANYGFTWLFYLDPRYPNVIVDSKPFRPHGMVGAALWYVVEMLARAEYYRLVYEQQAGVVFHDVDLDDIVTQEGAGRLLASLGADAGPGNVRIPSKQNETTSWVLDDETRSNAERLVNEVQFDARALADTFVRQGRRLASPSNQYTRSLARRRQARSQFDSEEDRLEAMAGPPGVWQECRDFQIDFLKQRGLTPEETVLDIGCGPLRGGVPLIQYLNSEHYVGFDIRPAVVSEAQAQIAKLDLSDKKPDVFVSRSFGRDELGDRTFDFVWCFQVLYHLEDHLAEQCLEQIARFLGSDAVCFANVNVVGGSGRWLEFPFLKRSIEFYESLAEKCGLSIRSLGQLKDFGYTRKVAGQHNYMLELRRLASS